MGSGMKRDTTIRSSRLLGAAMLVALAVAVTVVDAVARPDAATAASNGQWSVFPTSTATGGEPGRPFFQLDLRPGIPAADSVTIANLTNEPQTFRLYVADAFNFPNGAFTLERPSDPKDDMGKWIQLPVNQLTLAPLSQAAVPFTINVPANATPGDHIGGIVAFNTAVQGPTTEKGASVDILQAVGTRVYGRVAGPIEERLQVTNVKVTTEGSVASLLGAPVDATVAYTVRNSGNVRLTPKVDLKVGGIFGVASKSAPTQTLPELLPGGSATLTQAVDGVLPTGRITATVDAQAANTSASGSASTWAVPWLLLAIIAALIVGLWWRRRRRRAPRAAAPAYADLERAGSRD